MMTTTTTDQWQAQRLLLPGVETHGYYWLMSETMNADKERLIKRAVWWRADQPCALPTTSSAHGPLHAYESVQPVRRALPGTRPKRHDIAAVTTFFADFDGQQFPGGAPDALAYILTLAQQPTRLVSTGGGYHAFWLLDQPIVLPLDDDTALARVVEEYRDWVLFVGGDTSATDISQMTRVIHSTNPKARYGTPAPIVELVWHRPELVYTRDQLTHPTQPLRAARAAERAARAAAQPQASGTFSLSEDIAKAIENLGRLGSARAQDYNQWLSVGMALTPLGATGLALWEDWSRRDPESFEERVCTTKWLGFPVDPHGLAKLGAWANSDTPRPAPGRILAPPPPTNYLPQITTQPPAAAPEAETETAGASAQADGATTLRLPPGYEMLHGQLVRTTGKRVEPVYSGSLAVAAVGEDIETGEQTLTVVWNDQHTAGTATEAKQLLASGRELLAAIGGLNGTFHAANAGPCATYLVEFAATNADVLPTELVASRLGYVDTPHRPHVLITPGGTIGATTPVRYIGRSPSTVGADADVWASTLADILAWPDAPVTSLLIALSLAAPAVARYRPPRNPALMLGGSSNIGKSSALAFALAAWGNPEHRPFLVQAVGLTKAGAHQAMLHQRGLPLAIDEVHLGNVEQLEELAYSFANGESRTLGSLDGKGRGGDPLFGVLFYLGETLPQFANAGSNNRMLWLNGNRCPPLGAGSVGQAGTPAWTLGSQRSDLLRDAAARGHGRFGPRFAAHLWQAWQPFVLAVAARTRGHPSMQQLTVWGTTLSLAFECLTLACRMLGLAAPDPTLLDAWARLLVAGRQHVDPAREAFEKLVAVILSSPEEVQGAWNVKQFNRVPLAYQRVVHGHADPQWRVPVSTSVFEQHVTREALMRHGATWVANGWIVPDKGGEPNVPTRVPGGLLRCVVVPELVLETWAGVNLAVDA